MVKLKKTMVWTGIVVAALFAVLLIVTQISGEFRDVSKGGMVDLFRYLSAQYNGMPFESLMSGALRYIPFLPF